MGSESRSQTRARLLELQEGLKRIKLIHCNRVHLRKSDVAATAPFPVYVSIHNETNHPGHEQYDQLEGLKVTAKISDQVLQDPVESLAQIVQLSVVAPQLPIRLTQKMQQTLCGRFLDQTFAESHTVAAVISAIALLTASLSDVLPELLTLDPECMEAYESVGPCGNSQRRFRFEDHQTASGFAASGHTPTEGSCEGSTESAVDECAYLKNRDAVSIAITRALKGLITRFPDLKLAPTGPPPDQTTTPSVAFTVSMLPSDATWEHDSLAMSGIIAQVDSAQPLVTPAKPQHPSNKMSGSIATGDCHHNTHITQGHGQRQMREPVVAPHAIGHGMAVVLKLEPSELVDAAACAMVNQMLRKQAKLHAGKPDSLRLMLKYAESHLAELVYSAWDTLLADRPGVVMIVYRSNLSDSCSHASSEDLSTDSFGSQEISNEIQELHASEGASDEDLEYVEACNGCDGPSNQQDTRGLGEAGHQRSTRNSILVSLEGLKLSGTSCLEALQLAFQIACLRCTQPNIQTFSASDVSEAMSKKSKTVCASAICTKCGQDMSLTVAPHLVHGNSNALAHLHTEGCSPVDLPLTCFGAQCDNCGALAAMRQVQSGKTSNRDCQKCFNQLSVTFTSVSFQLVASLHTTMQPVRSRTSGKSSGERRAAKRDALAAALEKLQVGEPLPDLGTCKHYRHSHRWLRFPCCGLRFPCDLCHEELTDGHEMTWAKRMICGYCSLEQTLDVKCSACGKRLAATGAKPEARKTRFWEGGKGCRDRRLLDPRDKHKYKNSNAKTVSKRAQARKVGS